MEQMLSKFDAFGEVQSDLRDRVGKIETDLHTVKEDVAVLKAAANTHTQEIRSLKEVVQGHTKAIQGNTEAIHALQADVTTIKSDVAEIKGDLKNYNQRLEVVEVKIAS